MNAYKATFIISSIVFYCSAFEPTLIRDWKMHAQPVLRNFRTTAMFFPRLKNLDLHGLRTLRASGSGQFSARQLKDLKKILPAPLHVVDLREESHGFINGLPVSWHTKHNSINWGKSLCQVQVDELQRLKNILEQKTVHLYVNAKQDERSGNVKYEPYKTVTVLTSLTEEEICQRNGVGYTRIPVADSQAPDATDVQQFINLVRRSPRTTWFHFHCRAGRGRTTTFMVLYDMMRNADTVSLPNILARQHALDGVDLNYITDASFWKYKHLIKRKAFVTLFYKYCQEQKPVNFIAPWALWLKNQAVKK